MRGIAQEDALMPDGGDDAALVRAFVGGSDEALGRLYERHGTDVYRLAYRLTGSADDAEDVLHDVFVGLRRALDRYQEQGSFGAWLRTVAARAALMRVRRQSRRRVPLEHVEHVWTARPDRPVDRLALRAAIQVMPASLRIVFMLREVEGYSHREIADMVGISPGASRVRLVRAMRFLRERLGMET